jgi:hypothetical protein
MAKLLSLNVTATAALGKHQHMRDSIIEVYQRMRCVRIMGHPEVEMNVASPKSHVGSLDNPAQIPPGKRRSMKMGNTGPFPALCREVGIA